jgi:signal transduction histidine kinase
MRGWSKRLQRGAPAADAAFALTAHLASVLRRAEAARGGPEKRRSTKLVDIEMKESMARVEPLVVLAHELRNPIGAIRNAVILMESAGKLPGAMDQARRLIARQASQLAVLVDDLLDLASFARGALSLRREWTDIVKEVEASVESCAWALTAASHAFCVDMPDAPLYAYIDGTRVRQIVTNLLDNACKYTPAYGRIRLSLARIGDDALISVEDNGMGIESDRLPYVFDMFTRVGSGREAALRGLGVGLALIREIAELHGGDVQARSGGRGCGSAFVVRLPIRPSSLLVAET